MQKREPVIIAPDYTEDEIYEWMCGKIRAINDLKQAANTKSASLKNWCQRSRILPLWQKARH